MTSYTGVSAKLVFTNNCLAIMEPLKRCYKWCFVPMCTNTTFTTPEKTFLTMPRDVKIRKMWFKAARRDYSKITSSDFYCCEDHFDDQAEGRKSERGKRGKAKEKKGRAKGGIITGVKNEWSCEEEGEEGQVLGVVKRWMKTKRGERYVIVTVYGKEMEVTTVGVEKVIGEMDEEKMIMGGDFNARIGEEGGMVVNGEVRRRVSMDKKINGQGRKLLDLCEERGWTILNGNMEEGGERRVHVYK
ncbi:hypothetical protein RI129_011440 [Pyrocoelia pectoralis]|uniref:THAP-type domain-containing protein n=1 Tax=Pyrocoelia pectoralis TaxID=417401 RepID=A0AAN7V6B7_9COLE